MKNEPRFLTAEDIRNYAAEESIKEELLFHDISDTVVSRKRRKYVRDPALPDQKWKYIKDEDHDYGPACHIDSAILQEAVIRNRCVGIELLALGKPYGSIFNPDHWMYDSISDHMCSMWTLGRYSDRRNFA